MKISALVGVKDEEELIERCVDHLLSIGVDNIVVEDYGSTDSTLDILRQYSPDLLKVIHIDETQDTNRAAWGKSEVDLIQSIGADWVLLLDADEFWLPRTGSIRDTLESCSASTITVNRYNVPLGPHGLFFPESLSPDFYDQMMCYVKKVDDFREKLSESGPVAWISGVPVPKIAVRPQHITTMLAGHHGSVDQHGNQIPANPINDVVIAHLPFTSFSRFQRKVENIRRSVELQPSYYAQRTGWHWKRWIEIDNDGDLPAEYESQVLTTHDYQSLRSEGSIQSVSEIFRI